MIDIPKAKADAEEGLRIAEKVTPGPWGEKCGTYKHYCFSTEPGEAFGFSAQEMHWEDGRDVPAHENCVFVADSRTRAPEAYRNVIALADENAIHRDNERRWSEIRAELERKLDEAEASYMRSIANREQDLAEFRTLSARVAAAELAEEKMTRKAEEHYDRAVKAEAERDALRLENERHLAQSWAFETEIEQLRAQLDKHAEIKPARDLP